jgi:hypothetical protein
MIMVTMAIVEAITSVLLQQTVKVPQKWGTSRSAPKNELIHDLWDNKLYTSYFLQLACEAFNPEYQRWIKRTKSLAEANPTLDLLADRSLPTRSELAR